MAKRDCIRLDMAELEKLIAEADDMHAADFLRGLVAGAMDRGLDPTKTLISGYAGYQLGKYARQEAERGRKICRLANIAAHRKTLTGRKPEKSGLV